MLPFSKRSWRAQAAKGCRALVERHTKWLLGAHSLWAMEVDCDAAHLVDTAVAAGQGNIEPMDISNVGEPAHPPICENFTTVVDQENSDLQSSDQRVQHPQLVPNTAASPPTSQLAAGSAPQPATVPHIGKVASAAPAAPIAIEALTTAATAMFVDGDGIPSASIKPSIATEATKELVIKARDAVAAAFKAAGLDGVRRSWGRKLDKREALYYLLGWALGRGLLPVGPADEKRSEAGEKGDKYWVWAGRYETELAAQKKQAGTKKSALTGDPVALAVHLEAAARERLNILGALVKLELPSPQRCAAVERHARPKPMPPVVPSSYREPDLDAEMAEAEAEAEEAVVLTQAATLKTERMTSALARLDEPPADLPAYLAGGRLEDLTKYKLTAPGATFPERERKRREAEVRRYLDAHRKLKLATIEMKEAELASMAAGLKVKEVRARLARREEVRAIQADHHERRLREMHLASREAAYERSGASLRRREIQLAELRVALEAAEAEEAAREAAPVGVPVAASSANVVEGVLI